MRAHLSNFRKGWQSENLARYILSDFAFISQPSTIADDLGSDFIGTLFDSIYDEGKDFLVPKESFAIQIKSNKNSFDITGKVEYLKNLELPFFIGVCNKATQEIEIYSGEYLIPFFVDQPLAEMIRVKLCQQDDCRKKRYIKRADTFIIRFPKIMTVTANMSAKDIQKTVKHLSKTSHTLSRNITRKKNGEYIFFESFSNQVLTVQNPEVIKKSIDKRLLKMSYELASILKHNYISSELEQYKKVLDVIGEIYSDETE